MNSLSIEKVLKVFRNFRHCYATTRWRHSSHAACTKNFCKGSFFLLQWNKLAAGLCVWKKVLKTKQVIMCSNKINLFHTSPFKKIKAYSYLNHFTNHSRYLHFSQIIIINNVVNLHVRSMRFSCQMDKESTFIRLITGLC